MPPLAERRQERDSGGTSSRLPTSSSLVKGRRLDAGWSTVTDKIDPTKPRSQRQSLVLVPTEA